MALHPKLDRVATRIRERSRTLRPDCLARMDAARNRRPARGQLGCGNLAHRFAASGADKPALRAGRGLDIGIVPAYDDRRSAHQPMEQYPRRIRAAAYAAGGSARVASRVPATCDGSAQAPMAGSGRCRFATDLEVVAFRGITRSHASPKGTAAGLRAVDTEDPDP